MGNEQSNEECRSEQNSSMQPRRYSSHQSYDARKRAITVNEQRRRSYTQEKELILDNGFKKQAAQLPHFFDSEGPAMIRALTFDERRLLSSKSREQQLSTQFSGYGMKRSMTFVSKSKLEAKDDSRLEDVLYRKHFLQDDATSMTILPSYSSTLRFPTIHEEKSEDSEGGKAVIVVDTFSTGAVLAYELSRAGYKVVCVLSSDSKVLLDMVPVDLQGTFAATFSLKTLGDYALSMEQMCAEISQLQWPVLAVLAGAETGVELADKLSSFLGLRSNGTEQTETRRDKYLMGETIRGSGLRSAKQVKATTWGEIAAFLEEWKPEPFAVVVKPVDSAGSEDVILCRSFSEVQDAFGRIMGKVNGLGLVNKAVLVQEYLDGQEYVIDMVSRDGEHKVVAIWEYDRRAVNGASFVCFGYRLVSADDPTVPVDPMIAYVHKVCQALGISHGPSHAEVIWCNGEPVLIEIAARCHGGSGMWADVADQTVGYNQLSVTVSAYLSNNEFSCIPTKPVFKGRQGCVKYLVNHQDGVLERFRPSAVLQLTQMTSYMGHQFFVQPGSNVKATRDCFTWMGCVKMCHSSSQILCQEYKRVEELEHASLFDITLPDPQPKEQCVAVVDPFSTGASLAAYLYQENYKIVAVYSANMEQLSTMKNLIPQGIDLAFESIVTYDDGFEGVVSQLNSIEYDVIAVIAGAETGVELADKLSSHLGLRSNGTDLSESRRNKYCMGETIRKAGVRAVKQLKACSWNDVAVFLNEWNPVPFAAVVKPVDSAGSEDVTFCSSADDVKIAFRHIMGKVNGLGLVNKAVLVQEYLDGQEYVIDMVSRDGEHKVVAIWECDKRPVNGASFVLHGYIPVLATAERCQELIAYQRDVLNALGIKHGPSHGEVKWFGNEPVLVEVGARCHGGEGTWVDVANRVYGYNQVEATACVYVPLSKISFDNIPPEPLNRVGHGRLLCLVCKVSGILTEINPYFIEEIRRMRSFIRMEIFLKPGDMIKKTIDCFTLAGVIMLAHSLDAQVSADYERIREMEDENIFICEK